MVESNNAINNTVGASITGVTNTLTVTNPSNTASSAARETITVGGASAGDPSINWNISGVSDWEMGIDNGDSDKLKISQGTALGTNDTWIMTTAGERTMPLQPAFWAGAGGAQTNVTGDGTFYTIQFTSVQFDQNSDFDGTSTFTAPVDGIYSFNVSTTLQNLAAGLRASMFYLVNGISVQANNFGSVGVVRDTSNNLTLFFPSLINLTSGDAVTVQLLVAGGTKTISLLNSTQETKFTGFLFA
jgi:hypothetical protein